MERLVGAHVSDFYPQQVFHVAGYIVALTDLFGAVHSLFEGQLRGFGVVFQPDGQIRGQRLAKQSVIDAGPIATDDAASLANRNRPMAQELISLVGFAFTASITPGPNNLMLMASGTNYGFRRTLPHLAGVAIGFVLMLLLVGAGLGHLFTRFPTVELVLRAVCFAYLLFLAWKLAVARVQPASTAAESTGRPLSFVQAALFQWVNPKAWAMALTAMSVYLPSDTLWSALAVALVFGAVNLPCISTWTLLGFKLRALLHNAVRLKTFNVTMAVLLLASVLPVVLPIG